MKKIICISLCIMLISLSSLTPFAAEIIDTKESGNIVPMIIPGDDRDMAYSPEGGSWKPDRNSPDPDGPGYAVYELTFLTAAEGTALYMFIDNPPEAREIAEAALEKGISFAASMAVAKFGITKAAATWVVTELALETVNINDILSLPKQQLADASDDGRHGILVTSYGVVTSSGYYYTGSSYERWNDDWIWGAKGYTGSFSDDKTPIFY